MAVESWTVRAVEAAVAVARAHGVRCDDPVVLADRSNALVHLAPMRIVARVPTTTTLVRRAPEANLAREVEVTSFLAREGAAVVPPSDRLPPGPHLHDGYAVTFFRAVEADPIVGDARAIGAALAELHRALRRFPGALPQLRPALDETREAFDVLEARGAIAADDLARLRDMHAHVAEALARKGPTQALHGDAHAGNVLSVAGRITWNDFEDTCSGPVHWDLACMTRRLPRAEVLAGYGADIDEAELAPFVTARELQGVAWLYVFAERFPDVRPRADEKLRELLAATG